jgi:uncharacterized protein (TIGR02246 family)
MSRHRFALTAALAVIVVTAAAIGWLYRAPAEEKPAPGDAKQDSPDVAAVRKTAEAFAAAFNKGDAKAVAALCTKDCEYDGPDGDPLRGREAIEKTYDEFFKKNPKASVEVVIESIRLLGRHTALEEGELKLRLPGDKEPGISRYSVLHIREDDGWRMASIREWVPDPDELVSLKDVEWLLGSWEAKSDVAELRITYAWDEDKAFLRGRYTLKRDGKTESSGTQVIGKNPAGGLRSWIFDSSGTFGESVWSRDENHWVIDASGTLPDGSEVTATNLLIPLGKDSFTWQSVERTAAGSPLPDVPPVKVTRVKGGQ